MFKIYNGGEYFYQWDLGQRLVMNEPFVKVHFCNQSGDCALVCATYEEDGVRLVNVPNILLQSTNNIRVYGVIEDGEDISYSKTMKIFRVIARGKPESYVYTETEVLDYKNLENRIVALEDGGGSGGGAVASVNGKTGKVVLVASDVWAYTKTETDSKVTDLINSAIQHSIFPKIEREVGDIETALDEIIEIKNHYLIPDEPPINNGGEPDA
jgi:hypothetical protein